MLRYDVARKDIFDAWVATAYRGFNIFKIKQKRSKKEKKMRLFKLLGRYYWQVRSLHYRY